jgi:hypothetical protein
MPNPLDTQIGGNHYKDCPIQPAEYIHLNGLGFLAGNVVKRITRYNKEGGKGLEDLQKIKHEIDLLILFEQAPVETVRPEPVEDHSRPRQIDSY